MGEFAIYKGQEIKIGTCETMYYLRYEDRHTVRPLPNSLNPATVDGLRFRLPFPDEDHLGPGNYEPFRSVRLAKTIKDHYGNSYFKDWEYPGAIEDPGVLQLSHSSGLLVNVTCYHGLMLPGESGDFKAHWNGKRYHFDLKFVKPLKGEMWGVVACNACDKQWRQPLAILLDYVEDQKLRQRLAAYLD